MHFLKFNFLLLSDIKLYLFIVFFIKLCNLIECYGFVSVNRMNCPLV